MTEKLLMLAKFKGWVSILTRLGNGIKQEKIKVVRSVGGRRGT